MNVSSYPPSNSGIPRSTPLKSVHSFTLVELLVVIAIITILAAISVPVIGSLMRSNQIDQSVSSLTGILEQARSAATSGNTYVWVAFTTNASSSPSSGIWTATIQSQDGTEGAVNTSASPTSNYWTTVTVPGTSNLQLLNKIQNLPGVQMNNVVSGGTTPSPWSTFTQTVGGSTPPTTSITSLSQGLTWSIPSLSSTAGAGMAFTTAIEFTPDGEAHTSASTWYNNIQFGLTPSVGTSTNNSVLINVGRLTGKTTVYRP